MGGPQMAGVGWAAGVERLALLIDEPAGPPRPIAIVPIGEQAASNALLIAEGLRSEGFSVDLGYSGNLQRRMRRANRIDARAAVIIGDDELADGKFTLRDFDSGLQEVMQASELIAKLKALG